jgi:hypothetical protein
MPFELVNNPKHHLIITAADPRGPVHIPEEK